MRFEKKKKFTIASSSSSSRITLFTKLQIICLNRRENIFYEMGVLISCSQIAFFWWILCHSVLHMAYFINISNIQYKLNIGFLHLLPKYLACFSFWQKLVQLYLSPEIFKNPKTEVRVHIIRSVTRLDSCNKLF